MELLPEEPSALVQLWRSFRVWFTGQSPEEEEDEKQFAHAAAVRVTREMFSRVIEEPAVIQLLEGLEVHMADPVGLFDALDADCSGCLDVAELVQGVMKLRGSAEKSDLVSSLLAVRSVQSNLKSFEERVFAGQLRIEEMLAMLSRKLP